MTFLDQAAVQNHVAGQFASTAASAADLSAQLRATIDAAILPLIGNGPANIMLVDPPYHANVGDSLILVGELDFLRRHYPDCRISFTDCRNYSSRTHAQFEQADIILIHGGGNFGDIYPLHHGLRKTVLERFAGKPIIQMPQTVHFDDRGEVEQTARIIAQASNFTLLVRDQDSLDFARTHFDCPSQLVPDMAFAAEPLIRRAPDLGLVALLRDDKESVHSRQETSATVAHSRHTHLVSDWLKEDNYWLPRLDRKLSAMIGRYPQLARFPGLALREARARARVDVGVALLSRGERVVTDRLHGHIFCLLLGIPHFLLDSYGSKVSRFCQTWSAQCELVTRIANPDQLAAELSASLQQDTNPAPPPRKSLPA